MILNFAPNPLKDAPFEAFGKISVGNYDTDKPIVIGKGFLPKNEKVTLEGGEQFIVSVHGDRLILELRNYKS